MFILVLSSTRRRQHFDCPLPPWLRPCHTQTL